ncbi:Cyclin-like protein [Artemisia annua]|uniref:Cyclin-like protein n=1 Tax=Artemisia annua TaxID=35608 RepID=A0A2U1Q152_ARTAN|nr:Cyclin-like protein [Artemisia annua]
MTPCTILHHKMDETNEFLLCDEVWDMGLVAVLDSINDHHARQENDCVDHKLIHATTNEDCHHTFQTYLNKEIKYMTRPGYINFLESNHFLSTFRFKAIQWFIHSQRRLSFGIQSLFNAVNYVDRFIDINQCHGWSHWMMELLSLASLSIAIKFGETGPHTLHEIQEGLEYCFEAKLIEKMEYKILESLKWDIYPTTPQSFVELVTWKLGSVMKPFAADAFTSSLNKLLLASSLEGKMLGYQPSVIFYSGVACVLEDLYPSSHQEYYPHIASFFLPAADEQYIQVSLSCFEMMQQVWSTSSKPHSNWDPSSPDTVLTKEQVAIYEDQVDLSFIHGPDMNKKLKRKRKDDYNVMNKHKKCVH